MIAPLVFVTTAANSHEHSFACYYDKQRNTYLGDVYSVMWMEDSEAENLKQETLFKQFSIVRKETTTSHVQVSGEMLTLLAYGHDCENFSGIRRLGDRQIESGRVPRLHQHYRHQRQKGGSHFAFTRCCAQRRCSVRNSTAAA